MKKKKKQRRVYQKKMWEAARLYRKNAEKCFSAGAYFSAIVTRGAELEALLRIYDFVENRQPKDRCYDLFCLINRAFKEHWIPHDALNYWKRTEGRPLKPYLHWICQARNGVHAHLIDKRLANRRTARDIGIIVFAVYKFVETRNSRNLMKALYERGDISRAEYKTWKGKQTPVGAPRKRSKP